MKMKMTRIVKMTCKQWMVGLLVFFMVFSSFSMQGTMSQVNASISESGTRTLNYAESPADNPLKGFVGFRGAGSYSDFPLSMEYITMPMSEIVVGEGQYDWSVLESYLNEIASYGRQSVVSFYLDSPGSEIGVDAIPKYLLDNGLIVTEYTMGSAVTSAINKGYSPDYSNRELWDMAYNFVDALGAKYDGDARIVQIEASIVGIWGEWHTSPYDFGLEDSDLIQLARIYDNEFNQTQISVRYPKTGTNVLNVGYSDYSFCYETIVAPWSQLNRLKQYNATEYWKSNMGGGELMPQYVSTIFETENWSLRDGESYEECLQALHPTWLLVGSVNAFTLDERNEAIKAAKKLGYDFTVTQATFLQDITSSTDKMNVSLNIKNLGIAPFYYKWKVKVGVLNESGKIIKTYGTNWDLSKIAADGGEYTLSGVLSNLNLVEGKYSLAISVENPLINGKKLKFANETQRSDGWMLLGDFAVDGYTAEGTDPVENLPTTREKYGLDVSATDFPEVLVKSDDYFKVGLRVRNYGTSNYKGLDKPVMSFYKDGILVKKVTTDWNLSKINADNNNYFAWYLKGFGVGEYNITVQLTSDTAVILLGKLNIVNSTDGINNTDDELVESSFNPPTTDENVPTTLEKYGIDVLETDFPEEIVTSNDYIRVGVRLRNYGTSNYTGTDRPVMNFYKDNTLVKQVITDWDLSKINVNSNYYFCWFVKGLEVGTYNITLQLTSDTAVIILGNMKILEEESETVGDVPTTLEKYGIDVLETDFPEEIVTSNDYIRVGVRLRNYGTSNYTGTDRPVMNFYKDNILVKQVITDWDLSKINVNSNYYFCWFIKDFAVGTYNITLQLTSDTAVIVLGNMNIVNATAEVNNNNEELVDNSSDTAEVIKVEIPESSENEAPKIAEEVIVPVKIKVSVGSQKKLESQQPNKNIIWKSSNSRYASVSSAGILKANKAGGGKTVVVFGIEKNTLKKVAVYKVTIQKKLIKKIKVYSAKQVKAGKKVKIKISYSPSTYVLKKCSFTSNNKRYATVNKKGVVLLKKAGKGKTVKITVKTLDGSNIKKVIKIKIV